MATFEDTDLMNEQAADKAGAKLTPFGSGNMNAMILEGGGDYLVNCITPESGDAYKATGSLSGTWGGRDGDKFSKTLNVEVWNTMTTIEYRFLMSGEGGNLQYYDEATEEWLAAGALTDGEVKVVSRPLLSGWNAGDVITEQWRQVGAGSQLGKDGDNIVENGVVSYTLIGICTTTTISDGIVDLCEDAVYTITADVSSFGAFTGGVLEIRDGNDQMVASVNVTESVKTVSYDFSSGIAGDYTFTAHYVRSDPFRYQESESAPITVTVIECVVGCEATFIHDDSDALNRDSQPYNFTYKPSENMTNVLVEFTFAQGVAVTGSGDFIGFTRNGNQEDPKSSVWSKTMSFEACKTYTFTVDLTPDCSGSSGNSNVWTDFKVASASKKTTNTPTITESCAN